MMDWRNKQALVTGASSGIGLAIARLLASRGTDLLLVARRRNRLEAIAEELVGAHDIHVETRSVDLTDDTARAAFIEEMVMGEQTPDIFVNNAGLGSNKAFLDESREHLERMVALNVRASHDLARAVAEKMASRGSGMILNVASIAGICPAPWHGAYSATKASILHFSEALHSELLPRGVVVTALCPGVTDTEFFEAGDYDQKAPVYKMKRMAPETVARIGLDAMAKGKMTVVAGLSNKLLVWSTKWLPYSFVAWSAGRSMRAGR